MALQHNNAITKDVWKPTMLFFYGKNMDPEVLQVIMKSPDSLHLKPASISGWKMKMWGIYPAIVPSEADSRIKGMAYLVESEDQYNHLAGYEIPQYVASPCKITIDGEQDIVNGETFAWNGALSDLVDGAFDLLDYQQNSKPSWILSQRQQK
jgi:hypothetical protein